MKHLFRISLMALAVLMAILLIPALAGCEKGTPKPNVSTTHAADTPESTPPDTEAGTDRVPETKPDEDTVVETVVETTVETTADTAEGTRAETEDTTEEPETSLCVHEYSNWAVTTPPTCTQAGIRTGSCIHCGFLQEEPLEALGHTETTDAAVAPTCTKNGRTEGKHCSVCGAVLVAQESIAALGHTAVVDQGVDATCAQPGLTTGEHCSVCDEVLTNQETIPALGHHFVHGFCERCSADQSIFNLWTTYRSPADYDSEDGIYTPAPGYEYTDEGFHMITADYSQLAPYGTIQSKEPMNTLDGIYLELRVDDFTYGGLSGNADHWICFHIWDSQNVAPGNTRDYGEGWLGLVRTPGGGGSGTVQSINSSYSSFRGMGVTGITPMLDENGKEIYTFEIQWDDYYGYIILICGVPVAGSYDITEHLLYNLNDSGEFYIGVTFFAGVIDGVCDATILKYGHTAEDARVPQGDEAAAPERSPYWVADIADPDTVPVNQPALQFDTNKTSWNGEPSCDGLDMTAQETGTYRLDFHSPLAYHAWQIDRSYSYEARDFPVIAFLVEDPNRLMDALGYATIRYCTDISVAFNDAQAIFWSPQGSGNRFYGEEDRYFLVVVEADADDIANGWSGRISGLRFEYGLQGTPSDESWMSLHWAGLFRSADEAYAYADGYVEAYAEKLNGRFTYTSHGDGTCTVTGFVTGWKTLVTVPAVSPAGDRVVKIGEGVFAGCHQLTGVVIPEGVTAIGASAFEGCVALQAIKLPDSLTEMGSYVLADCPELISLTLPAGLEVVGVGVIDGCHALVALLVVGDELPANMEAAVERLLAERAERGDSTGVEMVWGADNTHVFSPWETISQPTCAAPGIMAHTCFICGLRETEELPAPPHTEIIIPGVESTQTTTGLTEGKQCSVCGTILVMQEITPSWSSGNTFIDVWDGSVASGFAGGRGTETAPYRISTGAQLAYFAKWIRQNDSAGKYFILTNSIDLNGLEWTPIGLCDTSYDEFAGCFDGNGYVISNFVITSKKESYVGLFGYVEGGTIRHLGVTNFNIEATYSYTLYAGGLVGYLDEGCIQNCYTIGHVTVPNSGDDVYAGGLVGIAVGSNATTIQNCYTAGDVEASSKFDSVYIGGLVGSVQEEFYGLAIMDSCYSVSDVRATAREDYAYAGGLVGLVDLRYSGQFVLTSCYTAGYVEADGDQSLAGGLVGGMTTKNNGVCTIQNCLAASEVLEVYRNGNVGYGHNGPSVGHINDYTDVSNCYAGHEDGAYLWTPDMEYPIPSFLDMNVASFYTDILGWDRTVWNLSDLDFDKGKYPRLMIGGPGVEVHTEQIIPGEAPTCNSGGWTEGKICADCGDILVDQEYIPALGHDYVNEICTRCRRLDRFLGADAIFLGEDQVYYTAEGHPVLIALFDPIEGAGNSLDAYVEWYGNDLFSMRYWEQLRALADENGYLPLTAQTRNWLQDVISGNPYGGWDITDIGYYLVCFVHEHTYEVIVTPPTCTEAGYTTYTCSDCGAVLVADHTPAIGHNYVYDCCTHCGDILAEVWDGSVASGFAGGSGTAEDPYLISTGAQLAFLARAINSSDHNSYYNKHYRLINHIDLDGREWDPIGCHNYSTEGSLGSMNRSFQGYFDGNGYTVSNFKITQMGYIYDMYFGLFGYVYGQEGGGVIEDLGVINFQIDLWCEGAVDMGGLVGRAHGATITRCYAKGLVRVYGPEWAVGTVTLGGLIGRSMGATITDCYAAGEVSANNATAVGGGFVGSVGEGSTITNCYASATVYAKGDSQGAYGGGFVGQVYAYDDILIANCLAMGNVTAEARMSSWIGGFVSRQEGGSLNNCYRYDGQVLVKDGTANPTHATTQGTPCGLSDLNSASFYTDTLGWNSGIWDFSNLDSESGTCPVLRK